ncbi:deoxyribose-phosphate aldolase [bacterium]|nr:deoxyribose-phosphate aldolase [bacterium]
MFVHERVREDYEQRDSFLCQTANLRNLAGLIDHTLLKPEATQDAYENLLQQAVQHKFRSICIPGSRIEQAIAQLQQISQTGANPVLCTVAGFPNGYSQTKAKAAEILECENQGAWEFDYVQNIGRAREADWQLLEQEARELVYAAKGKIVKVILETSMLTGDEIYNSALAAARGGVHILKTSTGFGSRGASLDDVRILRSVVEQFKKESGLVLGIKASGGIKSSEDAINLVRAGATRLGTSSGVAIISGTPADGKSNY